MSLISDLKATWEKADPLTAKERLTTAAIAGVCSWLTYYGGQVTVDLFSESTAAGSLAGFCTLLPAVASITTLTNAVTGREIALSKNKQTEALDDSLEAISKTANVADCHDIISRDGNDTSARETSSPSSCDFSNDCD